MKKNGNILYTPFLPQLHTIYNIIIMKLQRCNILPTRKKHHQWVNNRHMKRVNQHNVYTS